MPTLAAVLTLTSIAQSYGKAAAPYLVDALSFSFNGCGHKNKAVAAAAEECAAAMSSALAPALSLCLEALAAGWDQVCVPTRTTSTPSTPPPTYPTRARSPPFGPMQTVLLDSAAAVGIPHTPCAYFLVSPSSLPTPSPASPRPARGPPASRRSAW